MEFCQVKILLDELMRPGVTNYPFFRGPEGCGLICINVLTGLSPSTTCSG